MEEQLETRIERELAGTIQEGDLDYMSASLYVFGII